MLEECKKFMRHLNTCDIVKKRSAGDRRDWAECDRLEDAKCTCGLTELLEKIKTLGI